MASRSLSKSLSERAQQSIPGGVDSPVRSFRAVDMPPVFADHGEGAFVFDADGNRYTDYLMSWGAIILGHAPPEVSQAIADAARRGTGFGLSTRIEIEMAELIKSALPSIESLRFVSSGTEAVMSAVRVARGFTGRDKILKFDGGYHGHSDGLLARAGSGLATFGIPASKGVPGSFAAETLVARYNDLDSVGAFFKSCGDQIACVLIEPVAGNMGVVVPVPGFLEGLRELCDQSGALLIFDEVITGFRVGWNGAQGRFGVRPDLTTLGKIIGGGLPVGAFGGRREIMHRLAPLGDVYQAGTLSGNPVVLSAGKVVLETLRKLNPYDALEANAASIARALRDAAAKAGVPLHVAQIGSMFTPFFATGPITDYDCARKADAKLYARFFRALLDAGVLTPPSQWEAAFVSVAHTPETIAQTARRMAEALAELSR